MGSGKGQSKRIKTTTLNKNAVRNEESSIVINSVTDNTYNQKLEELRNMLPTRNLKYKPEIEKIEDTDHEVGKPRYWRYALGQIKDNHDTVSLRTARRKKSNGIDYQENPRYLFGDLHVGMDIFKRGSGGKDDEPIGDLNIYVTNSENNDVEVRIGSFDLRDYPHHDDPDKIAEVKSRRKSGIPSENIGKGYGAYCMDELNKILRNEGVKRVSLSAVGGGAYFWATQGFDLDPREEATKEERKLPVEEMREAMVARHSKLIAKNMKMNFSKGEIDLFTRKVEENKPQSIQEMIKLLPQDQIIHPETGIQQKAAVLAVEHVPWDGVKFLY